MSKRKAKTKEPEGIKIWIVRDHKQVVIGEVRGDTFYKRIRSSLHFLDTPPAIATDYAALDQAQRMGATRVEVFDSDQGVTYRTALRNFWVYGIDTDRGHNPQLALLLGYWDTDAPQQPELPF